MRIFLTKIPLLKMIVRTGGVRIALQAMRTPPVQMGAKVQTFFCLFGSLGVNKMKKIKVNLNSKLYQNYTADLYHFKTAVDNLFKTVILAS